MRSCKLPLLINDNVIFFNLSVGYLISLFFHYIVVCNFLYSINQLNQSQCPMFGPLGRTFFLLFCVWAIVKVFSLVWDVSSRQKLEFPQSPLPQWPDPNIITLSEAKRLQQESYTVYVRICELTKSTRTAWTPGSTHHLSPGSRCRLWMMPEQRRWRHYQVSIMISLRGNKYLQMYTLLSMHLRNMK